MGDSYRPSYPSHGPSGYRNGYGQAPAPVPYPPLPPEPPPGYAPPAYYFGQHGSGNAQQQQFAFQSNSINSQYPMNSAPPRNDQFNHGHPYRGGDRYRDRNRNDRPRPREPRPRIPTADRPLLKFPRGNTPDQLLGMEANENTAQRFRDVRDMSDSEEEKMIESQSEDGTPELPDTDAAPLHDSQALIQEEHSTTKWSNPELYTALPPLQDGSRKKKDVVKMIRKARVTGTTEVNALQQVAHNDDFISFDLGDEQEGTELDNGESSQINRPPPGAPSGPRSSLPAPVYLAEQAPSTSETNVTEVVSQAADGSVAAKLEEYRKRKRSPEDTDEVSENLEIELPAAKRRMLGLKVTGHVLAKWNAGNGTNPTPWVSASHHRLTEKEGFRLHKEICDFYDFVKPQDFEEAMRQDLLERTRDAIRRYDRECDVQCFGSFAAGLYLPDADMDVVVLSQTYLNTGIAIVGRSYNQLSKIAGWLVKEGLAHYNSIEIIAKAKVPLVKFVDRLTGIRVDMSFENLTGIQAVSTFATWRVQYPAMPIIATLIKQFLLMRELNEVVSGGIGGLTVTCLVTSLLQNMPRVQTGAFVPEQNLGELLLEFLDLYGNQFDVGRTAIQLDPPALVHKSALDPVRWMNKYDRLHIVDPNNPANDISGGSKNVDLIFHKFAQARAEILVAMRSTTGLSYLESMLGGNYQRYISSRERLRKLSRRLPSRSDQPSEDGVQTMEIPSMLSKVNLPTKAPLSVKIKKPKVSKSELASRDRALSFCDQYPDAKNVPDRLSKEQFQALAKHEKETGGRHITKPGIISGRKRAMHMKNKFPELKIPDQISSSKARELEGRGISVQLRGRFPQFADLIPSSLKRETMDQMSKAFTLHLEHPELDLPKVFTKRSVGGMRGKATSKVKGARKIEKGQERQAAPAKKKRRAFIQAVDGIRADLSTGNIGRASAPHGRSADDPVVLD